MLPIITQLWLISESERGTKNLLDNSDRSDYVLFAIEQPENDLHPRLQGLLTDVFVASIQAAKDKGIDLRLVIETHSETLVNRLGDLVAKKSISHEDINLLLFDPTEDPSNVKVRTNHFDADGYLTADWPIGFFNMEFDWNVD